MVHSGSPGMVIPGLLIFFERSALMPMNRRAACRLISGSLAALSMGTRLPPLWGDDRFAGFPPINQFRQAERTQPAIVSDGVADVLRPKWTRAMTDLGGWPSFFRFRGDL